MSYLINTEVTRSPQGGFPGICSVTGADVPHYGFTVPYCRQESVETFEQWIAVVKVLVLEARGFTVSPLFIPFIIDTGSSVTIIPRKLTSRGTFPLHHALRPYQEVVNTSTGRIVVGHFFPTNLGICIPKEENVLNFGFLDVLVVDDWDGEYAVLGLDALRRVTMIADDDQIALFRNLKLPEETLPEEVQRKANFYTWSKLGETLTPSQTGERSDQGWNIKVFHKKTHQFQGELQISLRGEKIEWHAYEEAGDGGT